MVYPNDKPSGSAALRPRRARDIDEPGLRAWLTRDLAMRNDAVLCEELPIELKALVMLFKA